MNKIPLIILLLFYFSSNAIGEEDKVLFKSKPSESIAYTTKDEYDTIHYHTESTTFHYLRFPVFVLSKSFPYPYILVKQVKKESIFDGGEGSKSEIKVTAWEAQENSIGKKLYEIEQLGHRCEFKEKTIEITLFGCCDSPDKTYYYNIKTGKLLK